MRAELRDVAVLASGQDGVVTAGQAATAGVSRGAVRVLVTRGEWVLLLRGTYLLQPLRTGPSLARSWARAAALTMPEAVVGLSSAAVLHGLAGAPRTGQLHVVVPPGREKHRRPQLIPHAMVLRPDDVAVVDGIAVTSVVRTLSDLVPRLTRLEALAVLDSALATGAADRGDLRRVEEGAARRRGCRGVRDLWALADGRAENPLESRVRLRCIDGGVPPTALQLVVRDGGGGFVARADLAFERRRRRGRGLLLLEADGQEVHSAPEALYRDRQRANALVALAHDVLRCTWSDTVVPERVPGMVLAAL